MANIPLMYAQEDCELGGKESIEDDFAYRNNVMNADKEIRLGFVRKVYGLLTVQLLATVAIAAVFLLVKPVQLFIHQNDWMVFIAFILSIVTLFALIAKRRDSPANFYLLAAFTAVQAYTVGVVVSFYDTFIVLQALAITFAVVLSLTLYTLNTKRDFSFIGYGLVAGLSVLIVGGLIQIFLQSSAFEVALSFAGAIFFSLFLIFDTQQMMTTLSPEEYILATINLYMDIINLFLYILRILNEMNRN
ncbi:PREDICTED: protein lifeguard 4-like [Papilio xuthus]|uniref:N-methyl-D-aspartate receptor-associated protein n=1 Tax=Papilio xuthus TaxID=66420 RepID=I4DJR3_PAPXU|nr:protein lifeguard 4-like [Papilio xuthus]XP_013148469.1 PREDICTED: protein lifeguard 4-like [Papilio polytes]KPI93590.1 Transmembrane BAX inhibitor motif-containing protein 4 [Papilio xuthus]BAM18153.1 N-methyl-D-aspartate receptor-associated protein [Papilio xuthus]